MSKIFVSTPYSSDTPGRTQHYITVCAQYCNELVLQGHTPIAPVILSHQAVTSANVQLDQVGYELWLSYCLSFLDDTIDEVHVLCNGNDYFTSNGVSEEVRLSGKHNIPIMFIR